MCKHAQIFGEAKCLTFSLNKEEGKDQESSAAPETHAQIFSLNKVPKLLSCLSLRL